MKKIICALLSVFFIATCFTGCKKDKQTGLVYPDEGYANAESDNWEQLDPDTEEIEINWFVNLSYWGTAATEGTKVMDLIYEKTKIKINYVTLALDDGAQLSTMISGNKLPDVITVGAGSEEAIQLANEGYAYPIQTLAEKYAPSLLNRIDQQIIDWYSVADGNIYGLPNHSYTDADMDAYNEQEGIKLNSNGAHDGELVIADIFGCKNEGERLGAPVVNEGNLIAEGEGVTIKDGFELSYVADGTNYAKLKATFDEIAFNCEYLAVDLTVDKAVNINAASDTYAVFELYVNNMLTGTGDTDSISVYCRSNSEITAVENKWNNWFFIPAEFDGILYISKTLIGNPTAISQLSLRFENLHSVEMSINSVFGCDNVGSDFELHNGTMFTVSSDTNTINATTVENTVAGITTAKVSTTNTLAMTDDDYVAVYVKMLSSNYPYGGPSATDPNTYIKFSVNDILLPEKGEITTHKPADGSEGAAIPHQWGNWVFLPYGYEGIFYFSVKDYLPGQTSLSSFTFTFNETHLQKMEYKVGVAKEVGGTPAWLDFVTGGTAENVKELLNLSEFKAQSTEVATVMPAIGYTGENNIVKDEKVLVDSGITVFDTYSYSYIKFGGIYLPEEWENQLVISVKTAFEGGVAINADDADEDFGYMELDLGENAFDMASGLALNVLCLSPECYFKVLVIDENGAVWIADHLRSDYTMVADRVPIGMSTLYNNFFYGEGTYGTLYIQKEWFSLADRYNGELLQQEKAEMGKITKVVIGMDHLWGLGRSMCIGRIANVDLENKVFTTVFNPTTMTDEQLGVGTSGGTLVSCPGSETHVNNFALRRLLLIETPGYEEPDTPVVPDDSSTSEPDSSGANTSVPAQSGSDGTQKNLVLLPSVWQAAFYRLP